MRKSEPILEVKKYNGLNIQKVSNLMIEHASFSETIAVASDAIERLEAYGYSGYFVRHVDFTGMISSDPAPVYDSYFIERSGLADSSYVSFESVNYPGYYLRHKEFVLYLEEDDETTVFEEDASFKKVD